MAAPGGANQIVRCVIDDLIEFSGEKSVDGYMSFFKSQLIAESRGFINRMREEANTARNLVGQLNADDREGANTKLPGLNALIAQAEQEIETKEAPVQEYIHSADHGDQLLRKRNARMLVQDVLLEPGILLQYLRGCRFFDPAYAGRACSTEGSCVLVVIFVAPSTLGKERPKELEDSWYPDLMAFICYFDKMKLWFTRAHTEEQSFSVMEALGQRGDALRALEGLREIVARDVVKLEVLEQLVACTRVGIPLKVGYVADMEDTE
ncbi:hypothetical protein Tco_1272027 [Tanacetum coccineum]